MLAGAKAKHAAVKRKIETQTKLKNCDARGRVSVEKNCMILSFPSEEAFECSEDRSPDLRPWRRRLPAFLRQWHVPDLANGRLQLRGSSGFTPLSRTSCCPLLQGMTESYR